MRRPADASIGGGDDIVGLVLRTGVSIGADLPSLPRTAGSRDLILIDNSAWLAAGNRRSSQGEESRVRCEDDDR